MADINLNLFILEGGECPTLTLIDTTDLSVTINGGSPILTDADIIEAVPQDTTVTIVVDKEGYDSYSNSITVGAVDETLYVSLSVSPLVDFINITQDCHNYIINNTSTTDNTTFTVTTLDNVVVGDYLNVALNAESSSDITFATDGVYLITVKNDADAIIRQYAIIDICTILSCFTTRILSILCKDCGCSNNCQDYCKEDFEMKRLHLLYFDLFNRVNREYRLNSYYTTIDDAKIYELRTAQDDIDKLLEYCDSCGNTTTNLTNIISNSNNINTGCGCS